MSTYKRPIFRQGLAGKANSEVCNSWVKTSVVVDANSQGIDWAQQQAQAGAVIKQGLCRITSATALTGLTNQWKYTIEAFFPTLPSSTTVISAPTTNVMSYTEAINLREAFNTSTIVDGMDITSPASTIGPVGSIWNGSAWSTTSLTARVHVWVVYDLGGKAYAYFDRPNPIRCTT